MIEQWALLIFLIDFGLLGIFYNDSGSFDFLILIGIVIFLIAMVFSLIWAFKSFIKRQEKAHLMKEKVLPELISKFGKVISIEAANYERSIRFERQGTVFDVKVTSLSADLTKNIIQLNLPNLRERFYILHKSLLSSETYEGCQSVQITMSNDFMFYSLNPQFLANLTQKDNIRSEIYKYQKKVTRQFSIAFENGLFTADWHRTLLDGELNWETGIDQETSQTEGLKMQQLCQTAVVFHDELAKR